MTNKKVLSALCYFSVFIFPLLIPFVIYLTSEDREVKAHATRSFVSHIIPMILLVIGLVFFSFSMFTAQRRMTAIMQQQVDFWSFAPFLFTVIYSLLFLVVIVWNVFQGVRVLR